jgi:hypothetical protein
MSTVAGAVVTIDGDSSGLVGALQKGENALGGVKTEARKLSDQLREVTDQADVAAGALVEKIGGPGAIKALAGVGAAVAAVKSGVEMFLDSSEQLFKSYGDEGVKVWDDVEKSLFAVKGAFAEAVLGGGELDEMGAKLKVMFETVADVVNFLLSPVRLLGSAIWALRGDVDDLVAANDAYNTSLGQTVTLQEQATKTTLAHSVNVEALYQQALADIGLTTIASQEAALQSADAYQSGLTEVLGKAASTASKILADGAIYVQDERDRIEGIILDIEDSPEAMRLAYGALAKAGMIEEIKQIEVLRQARDAAMAKARKSGEAQSKPDGSGGAAARKELVDETVQVFDLLNGHYQLLTQAQADAILATEEMLGKSTGRVVELKRSEYEQLEQLRAEHDLAMIQLDTERQQRVEEDARVNADAMGAAMAAIGKAQVAAKAEADSEIWRIDKQTKTLMFDLAVSQNAKMLASAIVANRSMADVARSAIGNVVSALGDKAMVEAGEAAVAGNFAQATGYAAVGTTMYTVAAALGAQKKPNAGPPTERQQPVQNYAYNLRIDAAFADSESISRRFAQMQEGARQRGLIAGAA